MDCVAENMKNTKTQEVMDLRAVIGIVVKIAVRVRGDISFGAQIMRILQESIQERIFQIEDILRLPILNIVIM